MARLLTFADGFEVELPTYETEPVKDFDHSDYSDVYSCINLTFAPQMFTDNELEALEKELESVTGFDNFFITRDAELFAYTIEFEHDKRCTLSKRDIALYDEYCEREIAAVVMKHSIRHALNQPMD